MCVCVCVCVMFISKLAQQSQKGRFSCNSSQMNAIGTKHMVWDARKLVFGIFRIGNMAKYVKQAHVLNNKSNFCCYILRTKSHFDVLGPTLWYLSVLLGIAVPAISFFLYILPDPLASIIGRCTLYTPGCRMNAYK